MKDVRVTLKSHQVARLVGRDKRTIRRWIERGLIPKPEQNRHTRQYIWTLKDVEEIRRAMQIHEDGAE